MVPIICPPCIHTYIYIFLMRAKEKQEPERIDLFYMYLKRDTSPSWGLKMLKWYKRANTRTQNFLHRHMLVVKPGFLGKKKTHTKTKQKKIKTEPDMRRQESKERVHLSRTTIFIFAHAWIYASENIIKTRAHSIYIVYNIISKFFSPTTSKFVRIH